jgi:hypothetical protein
MNGLSANMAALSLVSGSSTVTERMMEQWEREDEERKRMTQELIIHAREYDAAYSADLSDRIFRAPPSPPMQGSKNISPYRVHDRRRKSKAARAARRKQRRNKKCRSRNTKSA